MSTSTFPASPAGSGRFRQRPLYKRLLLIPAIIFPVVLLTPGNAESNPRTTSWGIRLIFEAVIVGVISGATGAYVIEYNESRGHFHDGKTLYVPDHAYGINVHEERVKLPPGQYEIQEIIQNNGREIVAFIWKTVDELIFVVMPSH